MGHAYARTPFVPTNLAGMNVSGTARKPAAPTPGKHGQRADEQPDGHRPFVSPARGARKCPYRLLWQSARSACQEYGEHAGAMLVAVQFVRALARLLLIVSVSGAMPQPFAHVDGADVGGLRAIRRPIAITLTRALRPADGTVLTRDGVRVDGAGRPNHIHFGGPTARIGITPPGLNGALISQAASARRFASRNSASLRGPPHTI